MQRLSILVAVLMAASACGAVREAPFLDSPGAGAPTCVFMTGVTKNVAKYLPGVMCIMQRLHDLRSRYPLVLAVSADEAEQAQAELDAVPELSVNTTVIRWSRFPHAPRLSGWARRWQGTRVGSSAGSCWIQHARMPRSGRNEP